MQNALRMFHIITNSYPQGATSPDVIIRTRSAAALLCSALLCRSAQSVVGAPVAGIAGHQAAGDEQDQVHEPPDAQASQREQLPHCGARVAEAEAVDPEAAQEEGVEQRGDEVVSGVSAPQTKSGLTYLICTCGCDVYRAAASTC